jgi:hypothetical protein
MRHQERHLAHRLAGFGIDHLTLQGTQLRSDSLLRGFSWSLPLE